MSFILQGSFTRLLMKLFLLIFLFLLCISFIQFVVGSSMVKEEDLNGVDYFTEPHREENIREWNSAFFNVKNPFPLNWNDNAVFMEVEFDVKVPLVTDSFQPYIVVGCLSIEDEFILRQNVRNSWAKSNIGKDILVWFIVGAPMNSDIVKEAEEYNDILFLNIPEVYEPGVSTLPVKVHGFMQIAEKYFPETKYFMKTDDDTFVLFDVLFEYIDNSFNPFSKSVYCGVFHKATGYIRDNEHRNFVSTKHIPYVSMEAYASGAGYIVNKNLLSCMNRVSSTSKAIYNPNEDMFTGRLVRNCPPVQFVGITNFKLHTENIMAELGRALVHGFKEEGDLDYVYELNEPFMKNSTKLQHTQAYLQKIEFIKISEESIENYYPIGIFDTIISKIHEVDSHKPWIWNDNTMFSGKRVKVSVPFVRKSLKPYTVVGCLSKEESFIQRQNIRNSLADSSIGKDILVWFIVGAPMNSDIIKESGEYNDILFMNIPEVYEPGINMSPIKVHGFMKIAGRYFPETKYFMKINENTLVLFDELFEYINNSSNSFSGKEMFGIFQKDVQMISFSQENNITYNSDEQYKFINTETYPDELGYMLNDELVDCINKQPSNQLNNITNESIFVSSLVTYCTPIQFVDISSYLLQSNISITEEEEEQEILNQLDCTNFNNCTQLESTLASSQSSEKEEPISTNFEEYNFINNPQKESNFEIYNTVKDVNIKEDTQEYDVENEATLENQYVFVVAIVLSQITVIVIIIAAYKAKKKRAE